jgi:putative ABC transport system permease protein
MWQSYLFAALHNLLRNRVYAAINILGLALGFSAAFLIALYVRDELTFDQFFAGHERVYRVLMDVTEPGRSTIHSPIIPAGVAATLESEFPEVEMATRLSPGLGTLRQGDVEVLPQKFYSADSNFFRMFPFRTVSGVLTTALDQPNSIVLSQSMAHQLFGSGPVLGRTLLLNRARSIEVTAVIEDLPWHSHMALDAVISGQLTNAYTYVRLREGTSPTVLSATMQELVAHREPGAARRYTLTQLSDVHFLPPSGAFDMRPPGDRRSLGVLALIAAVILVVAVCNFVSMMTARAARRSVEVGVRKAAGATRGQITMQFLSECLLLCALAFGVAMLAVAVILPAFNRFLQRDSGFDFFRDPVLFSGVVVAWLVVALLAGLYPALALAQFRPATTLTGGFFLPGGTSRLREALAVLQFSTLLALMIATITINRQTHFALEDGLRVPGEQVFRSPFTCGALPSVRDVVANIPGVLRASCASERDQTGRLLFSSQGKEVEIRGMPVDARYLALMNVQPVAGRLLDEGRGEDMTLMPVTGAAAPAPPSNPAVVINESAARALGFADPRQAAGSYRRWRLPGTTTGRMLPGESDSSQIVGVVPDFSLGSVRERIEPTAYYIDSRNAYSLYLRLDGTRLPEAMRAVEAAVKRETQGAPLVGRFLSQVLDDLHGDIRRLGTLFTAFTAVALGIAALGLLGLAIYTAESRIREIGVRKCMGASRLDILRFIGWQFARPVLLANLVAWPLAWFFMHRWLQSFAYHVNLGLSTFVLASAIVLGIALATVAGHAVLVARSRPVEALRHE